MEYRKLGKTSMEAGEVGIGGEYLEFEDAVTTERVMHAAMDMGVNVLDIFMSEPNVRTNLGKAIRGRREKIYIQGHYGSIFEKGQYTQSRDAAKCDTAFQDLLDRLETDYIDIGMIHYIDSFEEWDRIRNTDFLERYLRLKDKGMIRHTGFSSHNASVAMEVVKSGLFEVLMFSINPTFDYVLDGNDMMQYMEDFGSMKVGGRVNADPVRAQLYSFCEEQGVGITVMKALGAGRLLKAESSPFNYAMTVNQCIHYALSKPAVGSVLIGAKSVEEIEDAVSYENATDAEKDFSGIFEHMDDVRPGQCMYCNHCLPCPSYINVAAVTKLVDDGKNDITEEMKAEYGRLEHKGSECIECGQCEKRCPFSVKVIGNMKLAEKMYE